MKIFRVPTLLTIAICVVHGYTAFAQMTIDAQSPWPRRACPPRCPTPHPTQGNVANQLNQSELGRLQSGNFTPPPAPEMSSEAPMAPMPPSSPNPNRMNRMSSGGRAASQRATSGMATSGGPRSQ